MTGVAAGSAIWQTEGAPLDAVESGKVMEAAALLAEAARLAVQLHHHFPGVEMTAPAAAIKFLFLVEACVAAIHLHAVKWGRESSRPYPHFSANTT